MRTPWRVNCDGSWRKARSWTVTASGALVPHGTSPVAWATSISPITDSTFGQFSRFQVSYSNGRLSGSMANSPVGRYSGWGIFG